MPDTPRQGEPAVESVTTSKTRFYADIGKAFTASEDLGSVSGNGGTETISFTTTDSQEIHLPIYQLAATTGPGKFVLFEGADVEDDGTPIDARNLNRNGAGETPNIIVNEGATINSTGTELETTRVVGGRKIGGQIRSTLAEWVLKNETTYLMQYINESTSEAEASFEMVWCEEES